jgi:hypothetical protein
LECSLSKKYPTWAEFLYRQCWEVGQPRLTGTVTLFWEEGLWKMALNDRDTGASCFISGKTLSDLMLTAEKGLCDDSLPWRLKDARKGRGRG